MQSKPRRGAEGQTKARRGEFVSSMGSTIWGSATNDPPPGQRLAVPTRKHGSEETVASVWGGSLRGMPTIGLSRCLRRLSM